ncbi:Molybdenum cofactor sulfurase [Gracilaria domingensis]|nr:Molybdenum cofactor sulfurase [Gracilaria domingensis]
MATIRPFWNENAHLVLTAPESPDFVLPLADNENDECRRSARVWSHVVPNAIDCGDAVSHWLSVSLSVPGLRLVRMPHDHRRPVKKKNCDTQIVSFADGYPLLLTSEKSREAVRKLAGLPALTMQRFRPNVVVDGSNLSAFEEHEWRQVALGDALFSAPEKCERCQVPRIDPATGVPNSLVDNQPTAALKMLTNNHFGVNLIPAAPNTKGNSIVRIGDHIRLVRKAA